MTADRVRVFRPLSVRLRKGLMVSIPDGQEGVIVGFRKTRAWAGRRFDSRTWVIVELENGVRRYHSAAELHVIERTPAVETSEVPRVA